MKTKLRLLWSLGLVFLMGCAGATPASPPTPAPLFEGAKQNTLRLAVASPYAGIDGAIKRFNSQNNVNVQMKVMSSNDLRLLLQDCNSPIDAVGAADGMWLTLADKCGGQIKFRESFVHGPIALGVKPSKVKALGWSKDPTLDDVRKAVTFHQLTYAVASASQSNSGALALFGFLQTLKGSRDPITEQDLQNPKLQAQLTELFAAVNKSSTKSLDLKNFVLEHYDEYDATFNYEAYLLQINRELKPGQEPLQIFYLKDASLMADVPLAYVDHGNQDIQKLFRQFHDFLFQEGLKDKAGNPTPRGEMSAQGWRTGLFGSGFTPEAIAQYTAWGFKDELPNAQFSFPRSDVLLKTLETWQAGFRKSSLRGYVIDKSDSMKADDAKFKGNSMSRMKAANNSVAAVIDPSSAKELLLQATAGDVNFVVPFDDQVDPNWKFESWGVRGSDTRQLENLAKNVLNINTGSGTAMFDGIVKALETARSIQQSDPTDRNAAIIVLTDGATNRGRTYAAFESYYRDNKFNIKVYPIGIGQYDLNQLQQLAKLTGTRVFDGNKEDLAAIYREITGGN